MNYSWQKILFVFGFALIALATNGQRTDTVYLYNGDRITGEIKSMSQNKLTFKTDRAGTMTIEWPSVEYIYSADFFDIMLVDKERLFGSLHFSEISRKVVVKLGLDEVEKNLSEIVQITPIKTKFVDQLSGQLSISLSFTKANENLQINSGFNISHRGKKTINTLKANTVITQSTNVEQSQRNEAGYGIYFLHTSRWFSTVSLNYQKNTELNIDARYLLNAGAGSYFVRQPNREAFAVLGLSGNRERSITEPITETNNLEILVQGNYHQFRFRDPQIDVYFNIASYYSVTDFGRIRFDLEAKLLWELFSDFNWTITIYDNFDSSTAGSGEVLNDWSVLTGITYSL